MVKALLLRKCAGTLRICWWKIIQDFHTEKVSKQVSYVPFQCHMKVNSEHCTQNFVNNHIKLANLTTKLQSTMFERGKFEVNDFCVNSPLTHI